MVHLFKTFIKWKGDTHAGLDMIEKKYNLLKYCCINKEWWRITYSMMSYTYKIYRKKRYWDKYEEKDNVLIHIETRSWYAGYMLISIFVH